MRVAALPPSDFCLIRHGETTANAQSIIAGVTDVALTARGRDQARALARRRWPQPVTLFASPAARARDTCKLAFAQRGFTVISALRERDWGAFEGQPLSQQPIREDTPEGGESWPAMLDRVAGAIHAACAATPPGHLPVLVCHSGIIRAARVLWTPHGAGTRPPNAIPILFQRSGTFFEEKEL